MPSRVAYVMGALVACILRPFSCTAFLVAPGGTCELSRRPDVCTTRAAQCFKQVALAESLRDKKNACHGGSPTLPSTLRRMVVLQAAAEGGGQLREQEPGQREAEAAAARSKQLNIACNDVVRTILNGDVSTEKARALALRRRLDEQRDALVSPEDDMSALFFENLLLVCQHELHPDIGILNGEYGRAWRTILHYIEDAGWQLTDPPFTVTG